jgi:cell division protein FtsB
MYFTDARISKIFVRRDNKLNLSELKQRFGAFQLYVVLAAIIALCVFTGFHMGNTFYSAQQNTVATHKQSIQNLTNENNKLTKNLNILGVELEIAKLTQKKAFVEIEQGIQRETELREKIAFYQQVMAPELNQEGFLIDGFNVETSVSDRSYRFELVLIQQNKVKQSLSGTLNINLIGSENGQAKQYGLKSLLVNAEQTLKFGFKYFQVIQDEIKLPNGFVVEKVSVQAKVYQNRRKKGELTTVFDWVLSE